MNQTRHTQIYVYILFKEVVYHKYIVMIFLDQTLVLKSPKNNISF